MANYQIPISYVVSASVVLPQATVEPLKLSTILLLTDETPVTTLDDDYEIFRTVSSVTDKWGTETTTTKMAQSIFAQSPNILNNNGYLIIAPFGTVDATAGRLTTKAITDITVENFKSVTDGALILTVDGDNEGNTGLDFSSIENLDDIVSLLSEKFTKVTVTKNDANKVIFTSKTTGSESKVVMITSSTGTDLSGSDYFDIDTVVEVAGRDAISETYAQAITRMSKKIYFNGILTTKTDLSNSDLINASNTVQAMTPSRILFVESDSTDDLGTSGLFNSIKNNYYSKGLLYTYGDANAPVNAKLFASAYASKLLSVNYNGSNTCITMNLKDLSGINADTNISESILNKCAGLGVDVFASVEGLAKVLANRQGSYYSDQVQNSIWFVNTIQRDVFNTLASTRTKIPQTESGMQIIANSISTVCNQAVTNGYLAPGTWNSADTFGEYEDFTRNIEENGYYIYHQPVSEQSQTERETRKAPMFQIAGKEAGAVHSANILIYVEP